MLTDGMSFVIRPAAETDLPEIEALEKSVFAPPWSLESLEGHLRSPVSVSLAAVWPAGQIPEETASAQRVVGYLLGTLVCDEAEICRVAADPSLRRRGIGESLVETFISLCARRGAEHFFLDVRAGNEAAIALYEKCGFRRAGIRRDYYRDPPEDAVLMRFDI